MAIISVYDGKKKRQHGRNNPRGRTTIKTRRSVFVSKFRRRYREC